MSIELNILDWFQTLHTPFLDKLMVFIYKQAKKHLADYFL